MKTCSKLHTCPAEHMPAGSKTGLPLAKAISNSGSTSGIRHLRRGKIPAQLQPKSGEHVSGTTLQTPSSDRKEQEEVL